MKLLAHDLILGIVLGTIFGTVAYFGFDQYEKPRLDLDELAEWNSVLIGDGTNDFCSGTIIGYGSDQSGDFSIVSTAGHCIKNVALTVSRDIEGTDGRVVWKDKNAAVILGTDLVGDVAILRSPINSGGRCVPLPIIPVKYARGDVVYSLSNPTIKHERVVTVGIISALSRLISFGTQSILAFTTSVPVLQGSSGGAVIDTHGVLIGTVTGYIAPSSISFIAPVSATQALIQKLKIGEHICYG